MMWCAGKALLNPLRVHVCLRVCACASGPPTHSCKSLSLYLFISLSLSLSHIWGSTGLSLVSTFPVFPSQILVSVSVSYNNGSSVLIISPSLSVNPASCLPERTLQSFTAPLIPRSGTFCFSPLPRTPSWRLPPLSPAAETVKSSRNPPPNFSFLLLTGGWYDEWQRGDGDSSPVARTRSASGLHLKRGTAKKTGALLWWIMIDCLWKICVSCSCRFSELCRRQLLCFILKKGGGREGEMRVGERWEKITVPSSGGRRRWRLFTGDVIKLPH